MDLLPTSSLNSVSTPAPRSPSPERPPTGLFATLQIGIRNIFRRPVSLERKIDTGPTFINNDDFLNFLRDEKKWTKCPRTFSGIIFENLTSEYKKITRPVKFYEDTFIDPVFYKWKAPSGSEMLNCTFMATKRSLNWYGIKMAKICWDGSKIDGLYTTRSPLTAHSIISPDLSNSKMKNCTFRNLIITHRWSEKIEDADFSGSAFTNVKFVALQGLIDDLYKFNKVNFNNINAEGLSFEQVIFKREVSFHNAKINNLTLIQSIDFSGADFGNYKKGDITLSNDMFSSDMLIDFNLNSLNNLETGAYFYNTLSTLKNDDVRVDWVEQLVGKFNTLPHLKDCLQHPSLMHSVLLELRHGCYSTSPVIRLFISGLLLSLYKDKILPAVIINDRYSRHDVLNSLLDVLTQSNNLATAEIMGFQSIAHQLMAIYPFIADFWYQLSPLDKLIKHLCADILMDPTAELSQHHLFYNPATGRAIYLARSGFEALIDSCQPPTEYSIFTCDERGAITGWPANQQQTAKTLESFPALLQAWSAGGNHLVAAMRHLLSVHELRQPDDVRRVEQIATHWINLLGRKEQNKLNLTSAKDVDLLHAALAPFYEGEKAKLSRQGTVEKMRSNLPLFQKIEGLTEAQLNAIMSLTLAKVLTALSSSAYCGIETDSPRPLRLLVALFIIDCHEDWPDLVRGPDICEWLERLVPQQPRTFTCSAYLAGVMADYRLQIPEAGRISLLLKSLYPF